MWTVVQHLEYDTSLSLYMPVPDSKTNYDIQSIKTSPIPAYIKSIIPILVTYMYKDRVTIQVKYISCGCGTYIGRKRTT